jgi:TetR/AcrR family transcriptional regulator
VPRSTTDTERPRRVNRRRPGGYSGVILAAARRLAADKGTDFTTRDVIKEAGVALQTFYRCFAGKDQLILALIAELIREHCEALEAEAKSLDDPVQRLRLYIAASVETVRTATSPTGPQFVTSEHWRLQQLFPAEVSAATQAYTDLVRRELEAGQATGRLSPRDPERDAWLINQAVQATCHHLAFHPDDPAMATMAEDLWLFCLAAVGGVAEPAPRRRGFWRQRR